MKQEDAKKEAQRILHAPEAQQLLALLSRGGGQTLQQAAAAAQRGDMAGAQAMLKPLLDDPQAAALLEKLKQDEQNAPEKYSNCGQLFRLPDGLPIAPELLTKWYRQWRSAHPEFEQIVFHGLRHSSATYQLLQSDGDFKSVQGNTGHATASVLMDTYAHTQDKPRLELTEKIEANFYSQDLTPAAPQPRQNEKPAATKISGKEILEAIRLMDADERRELTRALFA